ncbi:MAG: sterol desaturase family protein [Runella slithyformis]|nr:MAG: sterol desaturase family protein [Runella slithyformis]
MDILQRILHEIVDFFRVGGVVEAVSTGNYRFFLTLDGFMWLLAPLAPFIILGELLWLLAMKRFTKTKYKVTLTIIAVNRALGHILSFGAMAFCINVFEKYAIFQTSYKWYWFIYAYVVYELGSFIHHYLSHKVRVLWCLHAVHHSSEDLNSSVTLTTFYLENIYTEILQTTFCMLMGLTPEMYFVIMVIDSIWGAFIHISEDTIKDGKLDFLDKIMLTPSSHRVHHAKHPLYLDTNYCSVLKIWDVIFGTYQKEEKGVPLEYGITRPINAQSFMDVYFGDLVLLWEDIKTAPGLANKFLYIFMPPGWQHDGNGMTARDVRKEYLTLEQKQGASA